MRKKIVTTGRLTILVIIIMVILFATQYVAYSLVINTQLQTNANRRLSQMHSVVSERLSATYQEVNQNVDRFLDNISLDIQLPYTYAMLVDSSGYVLCSDGALEEGTLVSTEVSKYPFPKAYSYDDFLNSFSEGKAALTRFHSTADNKDVYLYSDTVTGTPWTLMIFSMSEVIDGETLEISNSSSRFITTMMIIVVVLAGWLYFIHFFDNIRINRSRQLLLSERNRYKIALASNKNYIWEYMIASDRLIWDESNSEPDVIIDVSGQHRRDMINENIIHPEDHWEFFRFCDSLMTSEPTVQAELRARNSEGNYIWYRLSGTKTFDADGYPVSVVGQTADINEQKLEYEVLLEQAAQDSLTKLYNYNAFVDKANKRINTMEEPVILAFLLIDIDNFNDLNEAFGYVFADAVLIDIAGRLKKLFDNNSLIGRYGADEFVVLLDEVPSMAYVTDLAQNILNLFHSVFANTKTDYNLSCCVGVSIYPVDSNSYDGLFSKADIALYDAKRRGKGRYSVYNNAMPAIPEAVRHKKINKLNQLSSPFEKRTVIDSTIIANAIDILFDSRDINISINMMLSLIGIYYNLEHVFIVENTGKQNQAVISHEWCSDSRNSLGEKKKQTPRDLSLFFRGFETNQRGFYSCNDVAESPDCAAIYADEYLEKAQALLQCGIHYQDEYIAFINLCEFEKPRVWSKNEMDSLTLLSKLIGSYLLHLHSQEKIDFVSQMDPLTNAYNFNTFLNRVNETLAINKNTKYAMVYSDVYQFKLINDNYGYQVGDYILTTIAQVLRQAGGPDSLIARITGDKFVAMYPYETIETLTEAIKTIVYESKRIRQTNGDFYRLVLMIGIYLIDPKDSAIVSVDRANIARKNVIDYHICNYMYYNESMHNNLVEQKEIEDSMEEALRKHEFVVYYQPKIDIVHKKIVGSEALVRWIRPNIGMVPPIRFIPLFEENGFIVALDYYVLDTVCASLRSLIDAGREVYPVSVNFSRVHFNSNQLPTVIRATLERYNIPPELIEVEITESALAASDNYQLSILNEIHAIGCRLSMDDFGSGMSSLNILRDLPFDILKIDKDFLHSRSTSVRERVVITNVVRMAFDLDMDVICEGVETLEQENFLKRIGCFTAQGFLYAEPMPENIFVAKYLE